MSVYRRIPEPLSLRQHIEWLWFYEDFNPDHDREHVLPDGTFELIFNLEIRPRKLFDRLDPHRFTSFRRGWLSGTHEEYLIIDALAGSSMIGAHFRPGGAGPFLGFPAGELTNQVVDLDGVWDHEIWQWRERLLEATGPAQKFRELEQCLLFLFRRGKTDHQRRTRISWAIDRLVKEPQVSSIRAVSNDLGISHKHFIQQFRHEVGLTPKLFCRVRRFQEVLARIHNHQAVNWGDVVFDCGYYDQAHFANDFLGFSGVNPSAYWRHRLEGEPNFIRARG